MKKSLIIGLTSILLAMPLLGSCNKDNTKIPEENIPGNNENVDEPELSELAKKHNCISFREANLEASKAGSEGTKETYKVCGKVTEIVNALTGEIIITDGKNLLMIEEIPDFSSISAKVKIGTEIVVAGNLKEYYGNTLLENATIVAVAQNKESTPNPDEDKEPTPTPNPDKPTPNPQTGTHADYFASTEVMNMGSRGEQGTVNDYYEPCRGLKGYALKQKLYEICQPTKRYSYDHNDESFPFTDVDPDNPSKIVLTYTGERRPINNYGISINKEHTWPNSRGAGKRGPGADKHMIRPTENQINSLRSNYDFGTVEHNSTNTCAKYRSENEGNYRDTKKKLFEPKDSYKGDSARMIFYLATVYKQMELEAPKNHSLYNQWTAQYTHGVFEDLYTWATDITIDPVSKIEMNRNNVIDIKYQHNRNPFIDHPEFIEMIYSKTYDGPGALND